MPLLFLAAFEARAVPPQVCPLFDSGASSSSQPQFDELFPGDLDGDGDMDILGMGDSGLRMVLNRGNGVWGAPIGIPGGGTYRRMAPADFNGDGTLDIALSDSNSTAVAILYNRGAAEFSPSTPVDAGSKTGGIGAADMDGDSTTDIVVFNSGLGTVSVLLNRGRERFDPPILLSIANGAHEIVLADLTGDGLPEIVISRDYLPPGAVYMTGTVSVLVNKGAGAFDSENTILTDDQANELCVADLDNDGDRDIVVSTGFEQVVLINHGDATFDPPAFYPLRNYPRRTVAGDFDRDGDIDLAVPVSNSPYPLAIGVSAPVDNSAIFLLANHGDGTFELARGFNPYSECRAVGVADFDLDGDLDLAPGDLDALHTLFNRGDGTFLAARTQYDSLPTLGYQGPTRPTADFDGDGLLDLAIGKSSSSIAIIHNEGRGDLATSATHAIDSDFIEFQTADLDHDSDPDIAILLKNAAGVRTLLNDGSGRFVTGPETDLPTTASKARLFVGDYNGDEIDDLLIARDSQPIAYIQPLLNKGDGSFQPLPATAVSYTRQLAYTVDLDNDGDSDLVEVDDFSDSIVVLLCQGDGTFLEGPSSAYAFDSRCEFVSGDFDGDGDIDLAAIKPYPTEVAVYLNTGNATLTEPAIHPIPLTAYSPGLLWTDIDGNGISDLVVIPKEYSDSIYILFGYENGRFASSQVATGIFYPGAAGDIDGDGDADLLCGGPSGFTIHWNLHSTNCFCPPQRGLLFR